MKFRSLIFLCCALSWIVPVLSVSGADHKSIIEEKRLSDLTDGRYTYKQEVKTKVGSFDVEIHAREENEPYVKRVAQILAEDAPKVVEYFGYTPWNTVHFLVDGFVKDKISTRANGSATVHPRPLILLYTIPPMGMEHLVTQGDWVKTLVLHELIHILHIDQTAGIMKFFRYLFGSDGKVGGIVPGWFAEGLATWGESKFTNGGRLSRSLYNFDYNRKILDSSSCKSSVCLDDPGHYPYKGSRYWYGSHFLKWLEDKRPGTLSCIVTNNADNVPFFLHWAFRDCTNRDYPDLFDQYYKKTSFKLAKERDSFRKNNQAFKNFDTIALDNKEDLLFSSGFNIQDNKLFISRISDKHINSLRVIDLKNKTQKDIRLPSIIESIQRPTSISINKDTFILKTYKQYPSKNPINWKVYSIKQEKFIREIKWSRPNYIFKLNGERLIGLVFEKKTWEVCEKRGKLEEKLFNLPPMANLFNPQIIKEDGREFITFRYHIYSEGPEHEYLRVDLENGKEEVLFQSDDSLELLGSCGHHRVLTTKDEAFAVNIRNGYVVNLDKELEGIVQIEGDERNTVLLLKSDPQRIYYKKGNCEEWLLENSAVALEREVESVPKRDKFYVQDKSSYPELTHFIPQRWGIGYSRGDATSGWTFSTSINDPAYTHSLEGSYKIYTDHDNKGGSALYIYSHSYIEVFAGYAKQFLTSNTKVVPDYVEKITAGFYKDYYFGRFGLVPLFEYTKAKTIDFISSRKSHTYGFGLTLQTTGIHHDDLLNSASVNVGIEKANTIGRKKYWGYRTKSKVNLKLHYKFDVSLQGSFEKLDKSDLRSGVTYSGGAAGLGGRPYHEFYGIQSNDAFGNEVYSAKLESRLLLSENFSGPKYFPLYVKRIHAKLGLGALRSDFIFIDQDRRFLRDETLKNVFGGLSADLNVFYVASFSVDLIFTQVINDKIINNQPQYLLLLNAGL